MCNFKKVKYTTMASTWLLQKPPEFTTDHLYQKAHARRSVLPTMHLSMFSCDKPPLAHSSAGVFFISIVCTAPSSHATHRGDMTEIPHNALKPTNTKAMHLNKSLHSQNTGLSNKQLYTRSWTKWKIQPQRLGFSFSEKTFLTVQINHFVQIRFIWP